MRIGFSNFVLQGARSGVATYILNLLQGLQQVDQENDYDIITPECDIPLLPRTSSHLMPYSVPSFFRGPIRSILWHQSYLPRLAKARDYDLIHVPTYRRVPFLSPCKLVCTVHDLAPFHVANKYDTARMFYIKQVVPHLLRRCDHIITVSEFTRKDLIEIVRIPEDKVTVIYPGIDQATFRPTDKSEAQQRLSAKFGLDGPFLVYVSRLEHPGKNHVKLIEAFELLKSKFQLPHKLVFAGAHWFGAEKIYSAADKDLSDNIVFTGFVGVQDIVDLYSASDCMVYPSLFEGFGLPVIEAAACGARVICSTGSSLQEIAQDQFRTFDPRDAADIARAIVEELESTDTEQKRQARVDYARSFNWENTAREVLGVYAQVV